MDLVARVGGDEFVVLSPGADAAVALALGERLRSAAERSAVALPDGRTASVTLTCGVASAGQVQDCTSDLLLATADAALYQAKASGRNCTVQAKEGVRPSQASQRLQQNGVVSEIIEDESSLVGIDDD